MKIYTLHPTEDQEKLILSFLEENNIPFWAEEEEPLPPHVIAGIRQGMADFEAGRFITLEEFKKKHLSSKWVYLKANPIPIAIGTK
jgi:hypothetical protein